MAREVKRSQIRIACRRLEPVDGGKHGVAAGVLDQRRLQSHLFEALGDVWRISSDIGELRFPQVLRVADHQRHAVCQTLCAHKRRSREQAACSSKYATPAYAANKAYITVLANHSTWSSYSAIESAGIISAQAWSTPIRRRPSTFSLMRSGEPTRLATICLERSRPV